MAISMRPPVVAYIFYYAASMILTMAVTTLAIGALSTGSNDGFRGGALLAGMIVLAHGCTTAIPSILIGYPVWVAVASALRSRGETARTAVICASVAALWVGIMMMWLIVTVVSAGRMPNLFSLFQAIFHPLNLLLFPVTAVVGPLIGRVFLLERQDWHDRV